MLSKEKVRSSQPTQQNNSKFNQSESKKLVLTKPVFLISNETSQKQPKDDENVINFNLFTPLKHEIPKSRNMSRCVVFDSKMNKTHKANNLTIDENDYSYTNSLMRIKTSAKYDNYDEDQIIDKNQKLKFFINSTKTFDTINLNNNESVSKQNSKKTLSIKEDDSIYLDKSRCFKNQSSSSLTMRSLDKENITNSKYLNIGIKKKASTNYNLLINGVSKDSQKTLTQQKSLSNLGIKSRNTISTSYLAPYMTDHNFMKTYYAKIISNKIEESITIEALLGKGSFGEVYKVIHKLNSKYYESSIYSKSLSLFSI